MVWRVGVGGWGAGSEGRWWVGGEGEGFAVGLRRRHYARGGRREGRGVRETDEGCRFIRRSFVFSSIHH